MWRRVPGGSTGALLLCPHSPSAGARAGAVCRARAGVGRDRGGACGRAAWRLSPAALSVLTCSILFFAIVEFLLKTLYNLCDSNYARTLRSLCLACEVCVCGVWGPVAGSSAASALSRPAGPAPPRALARERERERERESSSSPVRSLDSAARALSLLSLPLLPPSPASAPHMRIPSGLSAQKETTILSKNGTQKGNKNGSKSNSATQCNHRNQSKRGKHRPPHVSHRRLGDVLVVQTASLRPRLPSS